MRDLLENPLWPKAKANRKYQRIFGAVSGILLAVALLALLDGLIALIRQGSNELEFLPGQSIILSGPSALKNPVNSDILVTFIPPDAPFRFQLDGFFTGYWFGNGLWRGSIIANDYAEPGEYGLRIAFRGASAQSAQQYKLFVYPDASAMQASALSWIRRFFGINPFILAALIGAIGILCGLITYIYGNRFAKILASLGLAEIYSAEPEKAAIWCIAPQSVAPAPGLARVVLDSEGNIIGEARAVAWKKGRLQLVLMDERQPPPGSLVCLRHPEMPALDNNHQSK